MTYASLTGPEFVEDYTFLRDAGLDHDQIAARFGVKRQSLLRRCLRNGCYLPERDEIPVQNLLDELVASGQPFATCDHFAAFEPPLVNAAVKRAVAAGRITQVDVGVNGRHAVRVWRSTKTRQEAAS